MEKGMSLEEVLKMKEAANKFLVKLEDNVPGVRFNGFKLRDCDNDVVYHEYYPENVYELDYFADHMLEYVFPNKILKTKTLGSTLKLVVGNQVVKNLVLVERHYIDGKLAANYDFKFPLFMPNSTNTIEFIYTIPKLGDDVYKKMNSGGTIHAKSDTFIFVEGKMIIHRRATYEYQP
jgi:hypothetical protein